MKFLPFLLIWLSYKAHASNYYISTSDGRDNRTAAQATHRATPWRTIDQLNTVTFKAGDSILFKRGDRFYGTIRLQGSGSKNRQLYIGGYGSGAPPLISGFITVAAWTPVGQHLWQSNSIPEVPAGFRPTIVLVGGVVQPMGRYPNSTAASKGYLTYESANANTAIIDQDMPTTPDWTGAEIVIRKNRYVIDAGTITAHTAAAQGSSLQYTGTSGNKPTAGFGYFIQNDSRTLDAEGEWYFDAATKKLWLYAATPPPPTQVAVPANLLTALNSSYVTVENIDLEGSSGDAIFFGGRGTCDTVRSCRLANIGGIGINISNLTFSAVSHCTLTHIGGGGINSSVAGANNYIGYNSLVHIAVVPGATGNGAGSAALNNGGDHTVTEYNYIENTGYNGIKFGGTHAVVRYNRIKHFCTIKDDGGALYRKASLPTQSDVRLYNNIISDGPGAPEGTAGTSANAEGIYADDKESGIFIYNNLVFNVADAGIYLHNTHHISVTDNLIYNCGTGFRIRGATDFTFSHNTIVAAANSRYIGHYYHKSAPIGQLGRVDSNAIWQAGNAVVRVETPAAKNFTFRQWQEAYPLYDTHSAWHTVAGDQLRLIYNETMAPTLVTVAAGYRRIGADNKEASNVQLAPFAAALLLKKQ